MKTPKVAPVADAKDAFAALEDSLAEKLIQVDDKHRIERGPGTKVAIATDALILDNNVTAQHYQYGKRDALGKLIVKGKEFTYRDWKAPHVWHMYELREVEVMRKGKPVVVEKYIEIGEPCATKEEALVELARLTK